MRASEPGFSSCQSKAPTGSALARQVAADHRAELLPDDADAEIAGSNACHARGNRAW